MLCIPTVPLSSTKLGHRIWIGYPAPDHHSIAVTQGHQEFASILRRRAPPSKERSTRWLEAKVQVLVVVLLLLLVVAI